MSKRKTMRKVAAKAFSCLMSVLLVAGFSGAAALTAYANTGDGPAAPLRTPPQANLTTQDATEYDLWVGGVQVTSENASNIAGEGITGTAAYDADTHTLTFVNATITTGGTQGANVKSESIDLTIAGDVDMSGCSTAIRIDGGSLTIAGGTLTAEDGGIYADNAYDVTVTSGTVRITATSGNGVDCRNFSIEGGDVAVGGSLNGIRAAGAVTVSGGQLRATGESYYGIQTYLNSTGIAVNGGTLRATGETAAVFMSTGDLSLGDGIEILSPANGSVGAISGGKTIKSGSTVATGILIGGPSSEQNYAVFSEDDGTLTFRYGVPAGEPGTDYYAGFDAATFTSASPAPWDSVRESVVKVVFDDSVEGKLAPTSTAYWFFRMTNLESIEGIGLLDTSGTTSMASMFSDCSKLPSIDLSSLDTSHVTTMASMFINCYAIKTLNLTGFDTSRVTDMSWMFGMTDATPALESITFGNGFDTSRVTTMNSMFCGNETLASLDLSGFDTSQVTDMLQMFDGCRGLTSLDLSSFVTSRVTRMEQMFSACRSLKTLTLGEGFTSGNLTSTARMFNYCDSLKTVRFPAGFTCRWVTSFSQMFYQCKSLASLDLSMIQSGRETSFSFMFSGCTSLSSLDLSALDTTKATNMSSMFSGCSALKSVKLGPNFKFKGDDIVPQSMTLPDGEVIMLRGWAILPTPPTTGGHTGKWWKGAGTTPYTPEAMQSLTGSAVTGTWTWATATSIEGQKLALSKSQFTYNGAVQRPAVTTVGGKALKEGTDYTLAWSNKNSKNAGSYTVQAVGKGDYAGSSAKATYQIVPAAITSATLSNASFTYDGAVHKPTVKAVAAGKLAVPASGYTTSYSNAGSMAAGTYTVTVTAKKGGNFTGSAKATYRIVRKAATWKRLAGQGRYDTMAAIVSEGFSASGWAVVATGDNFPDALAASALAGAYSCPVVLTASGSLSPQARAKLSSLKVRNAFIMGGTSAVSAKVESEMKGMGISVTRLAGSSRQDTAAKALAAVKKKAGSVDTVIVATGSNYPDTLSIGPWSYRAKAPIVLTGNDGRLSADTLKAVRESGAKKALIVGGTGVVGSGVEGQLKSCRVTSVTRLAGADRYETSAKIAKWAMSNGLSLARPSVATGQNYPDALAGAALAGSKGSVLLLADKTSDPTVALLSSRKSSVASGYFFGGTSAVTPALASHIEKVTK